MRMKRTLVYGIAVFLLIAAVAWLWSSRATNASVDVAPSAEKADAAEPVPMTAGGKDIPKSAAHTVSLSIPARFQFDGVSSIAEANSRDELMERYAPQDQERINTFYHSFGRGMDIGSKYIVRDIFWFSNPQQLEWLVQSGFPTPDEVLRAEQMSDAELEKQAAAGNFKAAAFLLGRIAEQGEAFSGRRTLLEERVLREGSPFGAYVLAKNALMAGEVEAAMAAYLYADVLGDDRSEQLSQILDPKGGSPFVALSSFQGLLLRSARLNPQSANFAVLAQQRRMPPP